MKHIINFILYIITAIALIAVVGLGTLVIYQMSLQISEAFSFIALVLEAIALSVVIYKIIY